MDGISALRELRKNEATSAIPVMAVTASAMPMERKEILQAGFDGYQSKPISVKELTAEVREHLDEIVVDGAAVQLDANTFRFFFTGKFTNAAVSVGFLEGTWSDNAANDVTQEQIDDTANAVADVESVMAPQR